MLALAIALWPTAVCGEPGNEAASLTRGVRDPARIEAELALVARDTRIPLPVDMVRSLRRRAPDAAGVRAEEAIGILARHSDGEERLRLAVAMAGAELLCSDADAADRWIAIATEVVGRVGDAKLRWSYRRRVGAVRGFAGKLDEAIAALGEAAELAEVIGDPNQRAATRIALARAHLEIGRHLDSLEILLETLHAAEAADDRMNTPVRADLHNEIGAACDHAWYHVLAIEHDRKALTLWEGKQRLEIVGRLNIAAVLLRMEDFVTAVELSEAALVLAEDVGAELGVAQLCYNIAHGLVELGRAGEAVPYSERAHRIMAGIGNEQLVALASLGLGRTLTWSGEMQRGEALLRAALQTLTRLDQDLLVRSAHHAIADVYDGEADSRALHHLRQLRDPDRDDAPSSNQRLLDLHSRSSTCTVASRPSSASGRPPRSAMTYSPSVGSASSSPG